MKLLDPQGAKTPSCAHPSQAAASPPKGTLLFTRLKSTFPTVLRPWYDPFKITVQTMYKCINIHVDFSSPFSEIRYAKERSSTIPSLPDRKPKKGAANFFAPFFVAAQCRRQAPSPSFCSGKKILIYKCKIFFCFFAGINRHQTKSTPPSNASTEPGEAGIAKKS